MFFIGKSEKEKERDFTYSDIWLFEILVVGIILIILAIMNAIESGILLNLFENLKEQINTTVIYDGFVSLFSALIK